MSKEKERLTNIALEQGLLIWVPDTLGESDDSNEAVPRQCVRRIVQVPLQIHTLPTKAIGTRLVSGNNGELEIFEQRSDSFLALRAFYCSSFCEPEEMVF